MSSCNLSARLFSLSIALIAGLTTMSCATTALFEPPDGFVLHGAGVVESSLEVRVHTHPGGALLLHGTTVRAVVVRTRIDIITQ